MPTTKKALNYDLDDLLLRKHYPNPKSYKNAWPNVRPTYSLNSLFNDDKK